MKKTTDYQIRRENKKLETYDLIAVSDSLKKCIKFLKGFKREKYAFDIVKFNRYYNNNNELVRIEYVTLNYCGESYSAPHIVNFQ